MQGRQNVNTERKGPHKSMHCKFCKPPGVTTPEKPTRPQMETKTKIHLVHEAADLRLSNICNEPGAQPVENEACVCVLEGENDCPKCLPDKNRPPPKKKVCRCPKGAKPHPGVSDKTTVKEKKPKDEDDEFWWEKYSREHDAIAKETWEAYMAQRRKDKKLEKCQKQEEAALIASRTRGTPTWYQKLSCQQMIYVEFLSTAIRLDSDENITDRTYFVLVGIGLYPRPSRKLLKRCLRYCHYNAIQFLNQLHMLTKDEDPFKEKCVSSKKNKKENMYTWNERLIMNTMCYLEFPALLKELMERLPALPRKALLPQIPYPVFSKLPKKKYDSPYNEPIWQDRLNWVEKMKIDRLNRCRAYMNTKRVKIPPLALMRRPSLIDARPPFLAQIEANERASRRLVEEKAKKHLKKHPISTFNSAVDVTAIAGIEASEISTTDKADTDDICVFLREPKGLESIAGEIEEEEEEPDFLLDKEVRFLEEPAKVEETQVNQIKVFTDFEENSVEGEAEDIPFKTPPKTESGVTIKSPCPPPNTTPGPPATHYDKGRRELDIIKESICGFCPFVSSSTYTVKNDTSVVQDDVELKLKSAAAKLKKIAAGIQNTEGKKSRKKKKKSKKKIKCKKRKIQSKPNKPEPFVVEQPDLNKESIYNEEEEKTEESDTLEEEEQEQEEYGDDEEEEEEEEDDDDDLRQSYKKKKQKYQKESERLSELSDPDPDTDDEWPTRLPCTLESEEEKEKPKKKRKRKRKGKKFKKKSRKAGGVMQKKQKAKLKIEKKEDLKKAEPSKTTELEIKSGQDDFDEAPMEEQKEEKREKSEVFRGNVEPLVQDIIKDLAEEGFYSASYPLLCKHPEVDQLILHLKGEIINKKLRQKLRHITKGRWELMKGVPHFPIPDLGLSPTKMTTADWNDKIWISQLAKSKIDQFYYKVASSRAKYAKDLYDSLYQSHFGTDRYLKIFYAYMISKYEDAILRGIH